MVTKALRALDMGGPAGDEAAREARIEAEVQKSAPEKPLAPGKDGWHRFAVDVWITNLNSIEFGIYKRSRNKAKSRQFSTDMDIFAEIIEGGERTGLLGYRKDLWTDQTGMDKRLVFKLFTGGLDWRATMDHDGRREPAADDRRARPACHGIFDQHRRRRLHHLPGALGQQVAADAGELRVLPDEQDRAASSIASAARSSISAATTRCSTRRTKSSAGSMAACSRLGGYWKGAVKVGDADKRLLAVMKLFAGMVLFNGEAAGT